MRAAFAILLLLGAIGCRHAPSAGQAMRQAMETVPPCWQPFGQCEQVVLDAKAIGKGAIVLVGRYEDSGQPLALYDPKADCWRACRPPVGVRVAGDWPDLWWFDSGAGQSHYWNLQTGRRADFANLPSELFVSPHHHLADTAMRPWATLAEGRCWSWIPDVNPGGGDMEVPGRYRVFEPLAGEWSDLPGEGQLPRGQSVLGAEETPGGGIRLRLGPRTYSTMRAMPEGYEAWYWARDVGRWTRDTNAPTADAGQFVRAGKGWWHIYGGRGRWLGPGEKPWAATYNRPWYGMIVAGGKVWGQASPGGGPFVEVTGVDEETGQAVPELTAGGRIENAASEVVFDGNYLWCWERVPFGDVLRCAPGKSPPRHYQTAPGLAGRAWGLAFTARAIWTSDGQRWDKAAGQWTQFTWRPATAGDVVCRERLVTPDGAFLLFQLRSSQSPPPYCYAGIAHYDEKSNVAAYYGADQIARGDWPFVKVAALGRNNYGTLDSPAIRTDLAWRGMMFRFDPQGRFEPDLAGEAAWAENGELLLRDTNQEVRALSPNRLYGTPAGVTAGAVWYLASDAQTAIRLDRSSGQLTRLGPPVPKDSIVASAVRCGNEVWYAWRPMYRSYEQQEKTLSEPARRKGCGAAMLDLKTAAVAVWPEKDAFPFGSAITPLAMQDDWQWGSYYDPKAPGRTGGSQGATFVAGRERKTGKWTIIPYLDGELWFDGPWVYANIGQRLHRADRTAFLALHGFSSTAAISEVVR